MDAARALRSCEDFAEASPATVALLAAELVPLAAPAGGVIFREGEDSDCAFVIESGQVRLTATNGGEEADSVADVFHGELLGEATALTGRARTTTAVAVTDVVAYRLPAKLLRRAVTADPGLASRLLFTNLELVFQRDTAVVLGNKQTKELARSLDLERERARRLRESDELRSEQIAIVAHDLRGPVSTMVASADVLIGRYARLDEDARLLLLDGISRTGRRLLTLVADALEVASIEAGKLTYNLAPFDVADLSARVAKDICQSDSSIDIRVEAPSDLPLALGDDGRHWQVLFNLLSNALKFSPSGSPVDIGMSRVDDMIHLSVSDRGRGIPEDALDVVFEKYSRIPDPGAPEITAGTGLGLYICRSMVEAQGGKIWVQSTPGEGSRFTYTLPVAD